jgi:hypothetical protein
MSRNLLRSWRERGWPSVTIALPFDDIMEFALALLSAPPEELEELNWSFADRKRLLDHFLRSGKAAQGVARDVLGQTLIRLHLPQCDIARLQRFARRALPKAVSNAAVLNRVLPVLGTVA